MKNTETDTARNGNGTLATIANSKDPNVKIRIPAAAAELWPLVKDEKRGTGRPVFSSLDHLANQINIGFHKGLIAGNYDSPRVIWVVRGDVLEHVTAYIEASHSADGRVFMRSKTKARNKVKAAVAKPPAEPARSIQYVLAKDSTLMVVQREYQLLPNRTHFGSEGEAALVALEQLGAKLYRAEDNGDLVEVSA